MGKRMAVSKKKEKELGQSVKFVFTNKKNGGNKPIQSKLYDFERSGGQIMPEKWRE